MIGEERLCLAKDVSLNARIRNVQNNIYTLTGRRILVFSFFVQLFYYNRPMRRKFQGFVSANMQKPSIHPALQLVSATTCYSNLFLYNALWLKHLNVQLTLLNKICL